MNTQQCYVNLTSRPTAVVERTRPRLGLIGADPDTLLRLLARYRDDADPVAGRLPAAYRAAAVAEALLGLAVAEQTGAA